MTMAEPMIRAAMTVASARRLAPQSNCLPKDASGGTSISIRRAPHRNARRKQRRSFGRWRST
jgi:hypothetical protein